MREELKIYDEMGIPSDSQNVRKSQQLNPLPLVQDGGQLKPLRPPKVPQSEKKVFTSRSRLIVRDSREGAS